MRNGDISISFAKPLRFGGGVADITIYAIEVDIVDGHIYQIGFRTHEDDGSERDPNAVPYWAQQVEANEDAVEDTVHYLLPVLCAVLGALGVNEFDMVSIAAAGDQYHDHLVIDVDHVGEDVVKQLLAVPGAVATPAQE